jgi:hypothetical protein
MKVINLVPVVKKLKQKIKNMKMTIIKLENGKMKIEHPSLKEPLEIHYKDIFMQTSPEAISDEKWKTELHLMDGREFIFECSSYEEARNAFKLLEIQVLE